MASYASYKRIQSSTQILDGTIPLSALESNSGPRMNVLYVYGSPGSCSSGCCCLWTVPAGVKRAKFELWGAGGNGNGACSCGRCQHYHGAQGGYYASKTISVNCGWTYTICAGGVYPCFSVECVACNGCASYVTGCNLSGFCAFGGNPGCGNSAWTEACFSDWGNCCISPTFGGSDFAMGNHIGAAAGDWVCHCYRQEFCTTGAPFLSSGSHGFLGFCWIRCGCWSVPYGSGGQSAMTSYCGSGACGQGGTGGSGLVKITYV